MSPSNTTSSGNRKRYIRWQKYQIEQMTFALNLFLGLSVGALAYGMTLVKEDNFSLPTCRRRWLLGGLIALAVSTLSGCIAVVSRLLDFRYTAKKIRDIDYDPDEAAVFGDLNRFFGQLTWVLFWIELGSFLFGLIGLLIGFYSRYGYRLS